MQAEPGRPSGQCASLRARRRSAGDFVPGAAGETSGASASRLRGCRTCRPFDAVPGRRRFPSSLPIGPWLMRPNRWECGFRVYLAVVFPQAWSAAKGNFAEMPLALAASSNGAVKPSAAAAPTDSASHEPRSFPDKMEPPSILFRMASIPSPSGMGEPCGQGQRTASPSNRGMTCQWTWSTVWPATGPALTTTFRFSTPAAPFTARQTRGRIEPRCAPSSSGRSATVAWWAFGTSRTCPRLTGLISRKTTASGVSRTRAEGISPAAILQKMQLASRSWNIPTGDITAEGTERNSRTRMRNLLLSVPFCALRAAACQVTDN